MIKKQTNGSYESTISFIKENGYGESEYRVKVTYNYGEKVAFLKSFETLKSAERAAKRELKKVAA